MPKPFQLSGQDAADVVFARRGWVDRLTFLGALFSWRTMTAEQAVAVTGAQAFAKPTGRSPAALFASGIMDLGANSNGLLATSATSRHAIYRTGKGTAFEDHYRHRLTLAEHLAVTGGQRWAPSTPYDRHNLLATELGIRLAEYTRVATVMGERFATPDLLVGTGVGREPISGSQATGDLVAVRPDGMRIVFEITANTGSHFSKKVEKWARMLANHPLESTGLCVVFVVAQHPDRMSDKDGYLPRADTYQAIAAAVRKYPGSMRDRVAERIGVATWREWFPARDLIHPAFTTLTVDRPTGKPGPTLWEPCNMLDPNPTQAGDVASRPFEPLHPDRFLAVIDNAALLGQTPTWLRQDRNPPEMWRILHARAGLGPLPAPAPVRPNRVKGRALGEGVGAAGATKPPARLLGLPALTRP